MTVNCHGPGLMRCEVCNCPVGRISPADLGLWSDDHVEPLARVTQAVRSRGATDWAEVGGWVIDETVALSRVLREEGVDLIDTTSGGTLPSASIPLGPGYQLPFAERIRREVGIATGAVGLITAPAQADQIIRNGQSDLVLLGRELLRNPFWPLHAAAALGHNISWPRQYLRAAPVGSTARQSVQNP